MAASVHPTILKAIAALERGDVAGARAAAQEYNDVIHHLFTSGRRGEAEQLARTALRINPRDAQTHHLFGTILSESNDLPAGEWHFRRALELGGREARCLANLALNLMQQGRTEESDECYEEAARLDPKDMKTLAHWSKLHEVRGDLKRAWELLARAESVSSENAVNLLRAGYLARENRRIEALSVIDAAPTLGGHAQLERGRLCDGLGRFDEAWRDFVEGKRKLAAEGGGLAYQAEAVATFFSRMKRFFVRRTTELLPRTSVRRDTPQPVFVLGFPRSGTTLVEQVLSSHSAVRAGGELAFIGELRQLANSLFPAPEPFPENLGRTWTADNRYAATLFRDYYLARAEGYGLTRPGKRFFVDKMPFNEMYLPLLRMAFPESPIVSVVRHPLDVCVSMMANNLTHGFNCGYRIEDIVRHFAAMFDLVEHYRRELQVGDLVLRYEAFVADQESETHRLLEYLGLLFEPACLAFHQNRRYAPTPSYAQVTEKLNARSLGRHRHYAAHLEPFAAQLAPMMAAYGYETSKSSRPSSPSRRS